MSELGPDLEPLEVLRSRQPGGTHPRPPAAPKPPRHVPRPVVLAAAGVVVVSALAVVLSIGSEPDRAPVGEAAGTSWTGAPEGDEPAPPGWRRGTPGPMSSRKGHVVAWTGSELLVWGGDPSGEGAPAGAAYHPGDDRWRPMAPAPFPVRTQAVAAWTGFEMLIWGGREPGLVTAGAYDPLADRWRNVAASPLAARVPLVGVWTGQELVIAGGTDDGRRGPSPEAAAYDPAADRWRALPPMPATLTDAVGLWTGTEVVVVGAALNIDNATLDPEGKPRAAAYDPVKNRWRTLPPPPLSPQALTAVWSEDQIVAWDYELHASGFQPSVGSRARWYGLPDLPLDFAECYPKGAWAGHVVFAEHCGQGAVYRTSTGQWTRVRHPRQLDAQPVWTGDELLFWVGRFVGSADGLWRFRPPLPQESRQRPVPTAVVAVPALVRTGRSSSSVRA